MNNARTLWIILALTVVVGGAWYLSAPASAPSQSTAPAKPQPVQTAAASMESIPLRIEAVGNVQSRAVVPIRPRIEGEVVEVHFTEGAEIAEGDILFVLDSRQAEAARRQVEANLARDAAQLDRARADLERYRELLKAGSATKQKLEQAAADSAQLEAQVKADRAALDAARLSVDYSRIKAPVSGRTGTINAKLGSLAKPGDVQPMVSVTILRPIDVAFSAAERHLPAIRAAMAAGAPTVLVSSPHDPALHARGRLSFIDSAIDRNTGSIALKAEFDNIDTRLWPGQFVGIELILNDDGTALTIPAEAVQYGQAGAFVFAVDGQSKAHIKEVKVDRVQDGRAILTGGLSAGERVVVQGQMRLADGSDVAERGGSDKK